MNYLLVGNDHYLINREINKLIKEYKIEDINLNKYVNDYRLEDVIVDCQTVPFFGEYKMIIIEDASFLNKNKEFSDLLLKYLDKPNLSTILVLKCNESLDKRRSDTKKILKLCRLINCDFNDDNRLTIIKALLSEAKLSLPNKLFNEFLSYCGSDVAMIVNDIEKLSLYDGELTSEVMASLLQKPLDDSMEAKFAFINALYQKDLTKVLNLYRNFKALNYEPLALIGLIESQFRFVLQVKVLLKQNMSDQEIASELKANPYRIKRIINDTYKYSISSVNKILTNLNKLDKKIKQGIIDADLGLELFLIKSCQ